jgi:hypothetical protein
VPSGRGELSFPVGVDVLQEQVAEDDRLDAGQSRAGECIGHALLVDLVDAVWRDHDLDERDAESFRLSCEQLAAHAVHSDSVVGLGVCARLSEDSDRIGNWAPQWAHSVPARSNRMG